MPPALELTGKRFGRLVVLARSKKPGNGTTWLCECDCGNKVVKNGCALNRPSGTRSCGCWKREYAAKLAQPAAVQANLRHGMSYSPVYKRWTAMIQRCTNPNYNAGKSWKNYGARGIAVCKRWLTFENFYADMGDPPEGDYLLDRIKNGRGYYKANCRWASRAESIANQRSHGSPPGTQGWRKRINGRFA